MTHRHKAAHSAKFKLTVGANAVLADLCTITVPFTYLQKQTLETPSEPHWTRTHSCVCDYVCACVCVNPKDKPVVRVSWARAGRVQRK